MALPDSDKVIQELNRRFAAPLPEFYAAPDHLLVRRGQDFEEKVRTEKSNWRMQSSSLWMRRIILK
jgi:hypothetical protein